MSEAEESDWDEKPEKREKKAMRKEDLPQMSKFLPSTKVCIMSIAKSGEAKLIWISVDEGKQRVSDIAAIITWFTGNDEITTGMGRHGSHR